MAIGAPVTVPFFGAFESETYWVANTQHGFCVIRERREGAGGGDGVLIVNGDVTSSPTLTMARGACRRSCLFFTRSNLKPGG